MSTAEAEKLRQAKALIEDIRDWGQRAYVDKYERLCAVGALVVAAPAPSPNDRIAVVEERVGGYLYRAASSLYEASVITVNDGTGRRLPRRRKDSHERVMRMYDLAIEMAERDD